MDSPSELYTYIHDNMNPIGVKVAPNNLHYLQYLNGSRLVGLGNEFDKQITKRFARSNHKPPANIQAGENLTVKLISASYLSPMHENTIHEPQIQTSTTTSPPFNLMLKSSKARRRIQRDYYMQISNNSSISNETTASSTANNQLRSSLSGSSLPLTSSQADQSLGASAPHDNRSADQSNSSEYATANYDGVIGINATDPLVFLSESRSAFGLTTEIQVIS